MNKWILTASALGLVSQAYAATDDAVPVVKASVPTGTYNAVQTILLSVTDNLDTAPVIYYTTNGKMPTTASTKYSGQAIQAKDTAAGSAIDLQLRTLAVDASGNWGRYDFKYRIDPSRDLTKPVVKPSLAAGKYKGTQNITLAVTDNADKAPKLYYTVDGTTPKETTAYLYKSGTVLTAQELGKSIDLRIRTLAVDAAGNKISNTFDYQIDAADTVAPVASSTPAPGQYTGQQSV